MVFASFKMIFPNRNTYIVFSMRKITYVRKESETDEYNGL